jgi:hypothetical protein
LDDSFHSFNHIRAAVSGATNISGRSTLSLLCAPRFSR